MGGLWVRNVVNPIHIIHVGSLSYYDEKLTDCQLHFSEGVLLPYSLCPRRNAVLMSE